jgi:tetratricopeptide (TPR) repeat protein
MTKVVLALGFVLLSTSCKLSSEKIEFERGEQASQKGESEAALEHFKKIVDKNVKTPLAIRAAKEAARITHYQLKRFREAASFYKHVILYAPDAKDRIEAQKKLADLQFNQTQDYNQAIAEYSRLLDLPHSPDDDLIYRLAIARSYFYLNNFFQAQIEIETIANRGQNKDLLFEAFLLKSNILLTTKKLDDAILTLKQMIANYPERAKAENIGLILAVTYEEQKNYPKAIETLEQIKDTYPRKAFIEQKIKTLKERQSHLPGARGLKK